jgi:3-hydroxyisobutyrate dehydrogenase-like beta-hydroxyacid dehydrogenase
MTEETIGLIGLGLMGAALAERLQQARYEVVGYDVDAARCANAEELGVKIAAGSAEVASRCRRILLSLPTTEVVAEVLAQMEPALTPGHVVIDTTTGSPEQTTEIGRRLADRGIDYLDATLVGSSAEARAGRLIVLAGGRQEVFDACADLFACFAGRCFHLGPCGSGSRMKLVTNLVLGLNRAVLAEGLALATAMGIDLDKALEVLAAGGAYSRVMNTKGTKMIRGEFSPQARLSQHLKDVRLILAEGDRLGARLPLSELHRRLLQSLEAQGLGDLDNSAIIRAFRPGDASDNP